MSFLDLLKKQSIENPIVKKRGRKPRIISSNNEEQISSEYRPPGWINSPLSFAETVSAFDSIKKKKKDLTEEEKTIVHNYEILKSCYRTTKHIVRLTTKFIGKFNFDPHFNKYGFTGSSEFAQEDFRFLSGYSDEDDGFSLSNWYRVTHDLEEVVGFDNPPFNRLDDAAQLVNIFTQEKTVRFAFLHTLDYTNYMQDCLHKADYFIMLGRVQFLPMPGIKISSARGSVGLSIYNSKLEISESQFISFEDNIYYCINLKKERQTKDISQLCLDDLLRSSSPEELALVSSKDAEIAQAIRESQLIAEQIHQLNIQNGVILK